MIEILLLACGLYLAIGLVCAVLLHARGLRRMDSGVEGSGWLFRVLVTPGLIALWPLLLFKWRRAALGEDPAGRADRPVSPRGLRGVHRWLATVLLLALPLVVAAVLLLRPEVPGGRAPLYPVPEALPLAVMEETGSVGDAGATWRLLEDGGGSAQVELRLDRDAALPALALYWAASDEPSTRQGLPAGAAFLGPVWGPGLFRFPLETPRGGVFVVYSLAHRARVATMSGGSS